MIDFAGETAAAGIVRALERCGVAAAFGIPGGTNHLFFKALRDSRARLIVPSHELAGAFMAGAYGRVSGQPGVLLTIRGPGFAYALAGIAEAWQDSAPLVHIVSAPPQGPNRRHRHQALEQASIAAPMVKAVLAVRELAELEPTIEQAFVTALAGEPGPVIVQLDEDLRGTGLACVTECVHTEAARAIWLRIHAARYPVMLLGQGCAGETALIRSFVERTGTPVFTTASGRGILPESSPWALGYDSLRGSTDSLNEFLAKADLIVAIGARLAYNGTAGFSMKLPVDRLVHVDASAANLNAVYQASAVAATTVETFFALPEAATAPRTGWTLEALTPWRNRIRAVHSGEPEPSIAGRTAQQFFALLGAALPDDALLVTDSGLHQVLARRYLDVRDVHGLLLPTDLQSMGFALPAAIAAKVAASDRPVVALVGDGGMLMSGLELAVAVREKIALTVIVFNDGHLNQIRMQQLLHDGRSHGVSLPKLDFRGLADMVGARYICGDESMVACLREIKSHAGVTLIDVSVRDGLSVLAAAGRRRVGAALKHALGDHGQRMRRWLGR